MSGICSTATNLNGAVVATTSNSNKTQNINKDTDKEEYYALASQEESDAQYGEEEEEYEESSPSVSDDQVSSSSINQASDEQQEFENDPLIIQRQPSFKTGKSSSFFEQGITENEDSFIICFKQAEKQREGSLGDRNSVFLKQSVGRSIGAGTGFSKNTAMSHQVSHPLLDEKKLPNNTHSALINYRNEQNRFVSQKQIESHTLNERANATKSLGNLSNDKTPEKNVHLNTQSPLQVEDYGDVQSQKQPRLNRASSHLSQKDAGGQPLLTKNHHSSSFSVEKRSTQNYCMNYGNTSQLYIKLSNENLQKPHPKDQTDNQPGEPKIVIVQDKQVENVKQFQPSADQEPPHQISNPQLITLCGYPDSLMTFLSRFLKVKDHNTQPLQRQQSQQNIFQTNVKRVIAQVVPRKVNIKNFKEDDPRLSGVQAAVLKKLNKEYNKIMKRHKGSLIGPQIAPRLDKISDRYIQIQQEELIKPLPGKTLWSFAPDEDETTSLIDLKQSAIQVVINSPAPVQQQQTIVQKPQTTSVQVKQQIQQRQSSTLAQYSLGIGQANMLRSQQQFFKKRAQYNAQSSAAVNENQNSNNKRTLSVVTMVASNQERPGTSSQYKGPQKLTNQQPRINNSREAQESRAGAQSLKSSIHSSLQKVGLPRSNKLSNVNMNAQIYNGKEKRSVDPYFQMAKEPIGNLLVGLKGGHYMSSHENNLDPLSSGSFVQRPLTIVQNTQYQQDQAVLSNRSATTLELVMPQNQRNQQVSMSHSLHPSNLISHPNFNYPLFPASNSGKTHLPPPSPNLFGPLSSHHHAPPLKQTSAPIKASQNHVPYELLPFAPSTSNLIAVPTQNSKSPPEISQFPLPSQSPPSLFNFGGPATVILNAPQQHLQKTIQQQHYQHITIESNPQQQFMLNFGKYEQRQSLQQTANAAIQKTLMKLYSQQPQQPQTRGGSTYMSSSSTTANSSKISSSAYVTIRGNCQGTMMARVQSAAGSQKRRGIRIVK